MPFSFVRSVISEELRAREWGSKREIEVVIERAKDRLLCIHGGENRVSLFINQEIQHSFSCTTGKNGFGNESDSAMTPLGLHTIKKRIGLWADLYQSFVARKPVGIVTPTEVGTLIPSMIGRILTLSGAEKGFNDSTESRNVYVHGTRNHWVLNPPHNPRVSGGCIWLHPMDAVRLSGQVRSGDLVYIIGDRTI